MLTADAFLRSIHAAPRDDAPYLEYADWLLEHDDPLAEVYRWPRQVNSIGMELVLIPPGKFLMGSPENEPGRFNDEDLHEVTIARPFHLGVYPVTQEQYEAVMGSNPSHFAATGAGREKVAGLDTRRFPVEMLSWSNAVEFCHRLSELPEEKANGRLYRLPSEAQWEYACRAGTQTATYFGDSLSSHQANFDDNYPNGAAKGPSLGRTSQVGSYPPNAFGLYDMIGNVWEWCIDAYRQQHQPMEGEQDGGPYPVVRGCLWSNAGNFCRAACRGYWLRDAHLRIIGFRIVLGG